MRAFSLAILLSLILPYVQQNDRPYTIYNLEFGLRAEMEKWYQANWEKGIKSKTWELTPIYARPDANTDPIGSLSSFYNPEHRSFNLEFKNNDGQAIFTRHQVGDWGYGIHMNVIDTVGSFVRLPHRYLKRESWIEISPDHGNSALPGYVASYLNQIVWLKNTFAEDKDTGNSVYLKNGNYMVEAINDGSIIVRQEVLEDFPCGRTSEDKTDVSKLPRYVIKLEELKSIEGEYYIGITYTRGC